MIKWHEASDLIWAYAKKRITAQIKAVAFIITYLVLFQVLVLNLSIQDVPQLAAGMGVVILGLALFIEGLILGIMPIGESLGLKLPKKTTTTWILVFAFIIGMGATFAEPAIGILRTMGGSVQKEHAPLLHFVLNEKSHELILSVGIGVGIAVIIGVQRFLYNWSLKPLIYPIVTICLALSAYALVNENFSHLLGLAWDCGAVTTGPVTVPLVLALGLGISRVVTGHTEEGTSSGFGVVTLASLLPIIAVLCLGLYYVHTIDLDLYLTKETVSQTFNNSQSADISNLGQTLLTSTKVAMQAILPLCLFMFVVFRTILREKFVFPDEITLGIIFAVVGLTLFNIGIETGLGKLGGQVGKVLPAAYTSIKLSDETRVSKEFDPSSVQVRFSENGVKQTFFYLQQDKKVTLVPFEEKNFNPKDKTYHYTPVHGPLWGQDNFSLMGLFIVLTFAFFMGYGATLAEPALNTLGATVEAISVGTFKKTLLIQTVAIGVGIGIVLGVTKIIWNIPLFWLLSIPYGILILLSFFSSEEFVNIAWDSAGVTTGPVTVPLVLAMGLGISQQSGTIEGFGILSMASVCPIMSVLIMGLVINRRRRSQFTEDDYEEMGETHE
jgi:hypothetical protein